MYCFIIFNLFMPMTSDMILKSHPHQHQPRVATRNAPIVKKYFKT